MSCYTPWFCSDCPEHVTAIVNAARKPMSDNENEQQIRSCKGVQIKNFTNTH